MKNFNSKNLNFFKYIFLFFLFFAVCVVEAQTPTCAGLNQLYQTRGVSGGVEVIKINPTGATGERYISVATLTNVVSTASGAASAFNYNTGKFYVHGTDVNGDPTIRVFDPAQNFLYVGRISLTSMGGLTLYDNLFALGNFLYFRDGNGNLGRINVSGITSYPASVPVTSLSVSGNTNFTANDYVHYNGVFYGLSRPTNNTTSCRLVMISNTAPLAITGRSLTLTNPGTNQNFDDGDFGAVWVDSNGYLFAFNNAGRFYVSTGPIDDPNTDITFILRSGANNNNDGFSCETTSFFVPKVAVAPPACAAAGTAIITDYFSDATISYIFYDFLGNVDNSVTVGAGGVISGLNYGQQYTVALHILNTGFTSVPSEPFTVQDKLAPVTATVTPGSAATNCNNSSVTLVAAGGVSYSWSPTAGLSDPNIANPVAAPATTTTYTVTVTSANGCTDTASATVTVNNTPITPTITTTTPTCATPASSTITNYSASNTYAFIPAGPTVDGTGLISGMVIGTSYTVTVEANGICASGTSASFTNQPQQPTPPTPTITTTAPTCATPASSTITNYSASNTYAFAPAGPTVNGTGLISNMVVGTSYTVTASDGTCTSAPSASFSNQPQPVTPAAVSVATTAPTCATPASSTITNYSASNTYAFAPAGPTVNGTGLISNMVVGTSYTVTASDGTCTSAPSASFSNQPQPVTPAAVSVATTAPTCATPASSTITNYSASNTYAFAPAGPTVNGTGLISNMVVGTSYTVTASDGTCTSAPSASFSNQPQPVTPAAVSVATTAPTCATPASSTITNYSASNTYAFAPAGPTVNGTGLISNMVVGTSYTVTASDGTCTSAPSASFSNQPQPVTPAAVSVATTAPTCATPASSTITNYSASNTYAFAPAGPTVNGTGLISNMVVGTSYTVTASDGTCTSAPSASFSNQPQPVTPAAVSVATTAPTCATPASSTITNYSASNTYAFAPAGPTVNGTGLISNMVVGTSYTVTASDGTCTSAPSASFSNQPQPVTPAAVSVATTAPTCATPASSTITNYSASNTYAFAPAGPTVNGTGLISNMVVGTSYTVTASDGTCTSAPSASFSNQPQPVTPAAVSVATTAPTCATPASSTITNYSASNTYAFAPAGPTVNGTGLISNMVVGTSYTVTASDGTCTSAPSASFSNQPQPVTPAAVSVATTAPTCATPASSTITNYSASNTYAFAPAGPTVNGTGLISNMVVGTSYTVTASDGTCTSAPSASFSNQPQPVTPAAVSVATTAPTCATPASSTITNYSASNTYAFAPAGPTVNGTGLISNMVVGTSYTVTASDGTCTSAPSASFSNQPQPVTPAAVSVATTAPTCATPASSTITNYSASNTYAFAPAGPTVNGTGLISNMVVGTSYTVTASDGTCTSAPSASFSNQPQPVTPAAVSVATTAPTCATPASSTITNYSASNTYAFAPAGPTVNGTGLISNMVVGTSYTVTASDGTCTSAPSASFSNQPQPVTPAAVSVATTAPTCATPASSTITNYSASNTYAFAPAGPTVNGTGLISNMVVGTSYTVTASDGTCTSAPSASFSNQPQPVTPAAVSVATTAPTCATPASSTITNYSASNTYAFAPAGPTVNGTGLISNMVVGTSYTVTASDGTCTSAPSASFSNQPQPVTPAAVSVATTAPTCATPASSTITNYSASNTYAFAPAGPTVNGTGLISNMVVGTSYTVTASDGTCTSAPSASFSNQPQPVTPAAVSVATTAPTCATPASSTITNYSASNTYAFAPAGPTVNGTGLISNMVVGTSYTVTASDGTCTSAPSASFSNQPQPVTPAAVSVATTAPTCATPASSTITNYSASNTYAFAPAGPTVNGTGLISNMVVGTSYTVTASDGTCTSAPSASFSNQPQPVTPAAVSVATTAPTCATPASSTITNYSASNTYAFAPAGPTVNGTGLISNMVVGTSYTVTASDGTCTSAPSASFSNQPQPVTPAAVSVATTAPTCATPASSTITNYSASNTYAFAPAGPTVNGTGLISNMVVGTSYTVTASDGTCTSAPSASFSNQPQPVTPAAVSVATTAPTCATPASSTITNYSASNTYAFAPAGPTVNGTGLISNMVVGTSYTVTASDGTCTSAPSASFSNQPQPVTPAAVSVATTAPTCATPASSTITNYSASNTYAFAPAGPTVNGTGLISNMVVGTSYTVTASDGTCTSAPSASFSNQPQPVTPAAVSVATTAPTCATPASSTITNYSASNTYAFAPAGPTVNGTGLISNMVVGTSYTVTASDGTCTSAPSASFSNQPQPVTPAAVSVATTAPTCATPASSTITNYSASNTYAFAPAGPTVNGTGLISNMVVGTSYTVTASDGTCTSAPSASFSNQPQPVTPAAVSVVVTQPECPSNTGSVVISDLPSGNWIINPGGISGDTSTVTITDLDAGTYNFTVTNEGGCTSSPSADVVIMDILCNNCQNENPIKVFNALSPGIVDGLNDFFYIQSLDDFDCYPTNTVQIYNRWGVLVFERNQYKNEISTGFVGISEGRVTVNKSEKLPEGTYFYIVNYTDKEGKGHNLTGYLELKWN